MHFAKLHQFIRPVTASDPNRAEEFLGTHRKKCWPGRVNRRTAFALIVILFGCLVLGPASALAQTTYVWNNTSNSWEGVTAWTPIAGSGTSFPGSGDTALLTPQLGTAATDPSLPNPESALSATFANNPLGGNYTLTAAGAFTLTLGGTGSTGLTARGVGTTTINGPSVAGATGTFLATLNVGSGSGLALAGGSVATSNVGAISVLGGQLTLDNTAAVNTNRLADGSQINFNGGGVLSLVGNGAAPTTETVANTGGTNAVQPLAGQTTLNVVAPSGQTTTLTVGGAAATMNRGTRAMMNFTNVDASGNVVGTLGAGAGNPNVTLTLTNAVARTNGGAVAAANTVLANTDTTTVVGWATINNSEYATIVGGNIQATAYAATQQRDQTSVGSAPNNLPILYQPTADGAVAGATTLVLKVVSDDDARKLTLNGNVTGTGLLLAGAKNFTIDGTGGFLSGASTRFVTVQSAVLQVATDLKGGSTAPLAKAGDGTLFLNAAQTWTGNVAVNGGTLRVNSNSLATATLELRGGVLELNGGFAFARSLGTTAGGGLINWNAGTGSTMEKGSGGFSAVGGASTVTLGSSTLVWGTTAQFVLDGNSLVFGSTRSDSQLTFTNNLGLDAGTTGLPYTVREVRVIGGVGGDRTTLSGAVTGSANSDLLKTGTGVLELTNTNTYSGNTLVAGGTLRVTGSIASGTTRVWSGGTLGGAGTVAGNVIANSGSNLTPGNGTVVGNLSVGGNVALNGGSTLNVLASGSNVQATGASQLTITGNLDLSDTGIRTIKIFTDGSLSFNGTTTYVYTIATMTGTTGTFNPASFNVVAGNFAGFIGTPTVTNSGSALAVSFQPVPEPSMVLLVCAAGAATAGTLRRRRTAS